MNLSSAPEGLVELLRHAPTTGVGIGVPEDELLPTDNTYLDGFLAEAYSEQPLEKGKRFERTKWFMRRCGKEKKFGPLTLGQIYTAVWKFPPAVNKEREIKGWLDSDFRRFIRKDWPAIEEARRPKSRAVNLRPFLDGTYVAPMPNVGGVRNDGEFLLYAGKWHTVIAPTASGKSWFANYHAKQVMLDGGTIIYLHFEESSPDSTVGRLRELGVSKNVIADKFIWLDNDEVWTKEEFEHEMKLYQPSLVVLDGINEACNMHGWDSEKVAAVGAYRKIFVTPATRLNAAVLSLGHPVKSQTRQGERHGFGSSAWLDSMDGVGFRLIPSKDNPIRRTVCGFSNLYSVKDRNGNVEKNGIMEGETSINTGWVFLGALVIDDTNETYNHTEITVTAPTTVGAKSGSDNVDKLMGYIVDYLKTADGYGYSSNTSLIEKLQGQRITFNKNDIPNALARLEADRIIVRASANGTKPRSGHLRVSPEDLGEQDLS
jgi:hypothetical protein